MNFWKQIATDQALYFSSVCEKDHYPDVNAHLHTPYSFSAFESIEQAFEMAINEGVKVLGINDFYSMDGYHEWAKNAIRYQLFPLFNIEFIGLSEEELNKKIRINDPNNPGRIYISGKGLAFPTRMSNYYESELAQVKRNANKHVSEMCSALNSHLKSVGVRISLKFAYVESKYTRGIIRERHLAQALRVEVFEKYNSRQDREIILKQIFNNQPLISDINNIAALENEIRSKLLKAGGPAFVPEKTEQFLTLRQLCDIILNAGGIPTYPLLADSLNGLCTEFESNKEELRRKLLSKGIYSIELIPNRNSMGALEEYASFFSESGFLVSFGSEHNTPDLIPVRLCDKEKNNLSPLLRKINFEGAAIIAAHQYLIGNDKLGFLDSQGVFVPEKRAELISMGKGLINLFNSSANDIISL